jgi:hypothetical protein
MSKRKFLFFSFLIIFGFALGGQGCSESKGEIWLINKTSRQIVRAEVEVCAQTIMFEGVQPGKKQSSSFLVKGECYYTINVMFSDKPIFLEKLGYVTSGFDYIDYLVVTEEGILLNPEGYGRQVLSKY